ncbi:MAG: type II secretory pathway, component PulD [Verrucomicrobia bacterium]|nr:type II secretory pathway, component PulD [Verrucomicrobiota bacterium]
MSLRLFRLFLALCLTAAALPAQTPPPPAAPAEELVGPIKLPDADIDTVLGLLEIYTGRSILRPQQLPTATYHLVIDKKIPKSEAILALETVLSLNQVGVASLGDKFLKVVALAQTKNEAPEMIMGSTLSLPPSGRVATKLFQFEFLRVNEFVPQISPLMTPGIANGIVALDKANAALITDTVSNLQRVETLLQQLDRPSMVGLTPKFYPLRNGAKASDIVNKLRSMFQGPLQAQLGAATSYSADDRSNQVILLADPMQVPLFDELIGKLDVKADPNTRNEVIFLRHASAKDVAPLLSQLVSGQNSAQQKNSSGGSGPRPGMVVQPVNGPTAAPNAAPAAGATVSANAAGEATNEFSTFLTILPDERSNSIVVSGTVDDIRLLRELVEKIDVLLAQVSIQVVIAEVTLGDSDTSGINALNLTIATDAARGTHVTNFNTVGSGDTGSYGVAGWGITSGVVNPLSFNAAMTNVGSKNNVKVLSANTIVTTHNKEAEFVVSQQQPIITGSQSTPVGVTTGATSGFSTNSQVTYKDIGIDVKVTPLIGDDGSIQLKIDQKVDDVVGNVTVDNNDQPIIGHRQATTFINVSDGNMVVLGGLQQTKTENSRTKLGFFYEIPVLSNLLGSRTNKVTRTELLLFVRPHVIPPLEGSRDTQKSIEALKSRKDVELFLKDPGKMPDQKLLDKYYK